MKNVELITFLLSRFCGNHRGGISGGKRNVVKKYRPGHGVGMGQGSVDVSVGSGRGKASFSVGISRTTR